MSPLIYAKADGNLIRFGSGLDVGDWIVQTGPPPVTGNGPTATATNTGVQSTLPTPVPTAWTYSNVSGTVANYLLIENKDFSAAGSNIYIYGSYIRFKNCKWPNTDIIVQANRFVIYEFCEAWKFSLSSAQDIKILNCKSIVKPGKDAMSISSDAGQKCARIEINGFYAVGHRGTIIGNDVPQIGGVGNHYDGIQIRGADDVLINNVVLDGAEGINLALKPTFYSGTQTAWDGLTPLQRREQYFSSNFNASIFLENANGGNSNITVSNSFLRGIGYATLMIFLYSGYVRFVNNVFGKPPPQADYLRGDSVALSAGSTGNVWAEFYTAGSLAGTPLTLIPGVGP